MKSVSKVTGINLAILLVYSLIIRFSNGAGNDKGLGILIISAFVIAAHVLILLIMCAVFYAGRQKEQGRTFLLSSGLVLLIGFSSCWANVMA